MSYQASTTILYTLYPSTPWIQDSLATYLYNGLYNATIGGPQWTSNCLCKADRDIGKMLTQFAQGLERYKSGDWSAPRLPNALVTTEGVLYTV